MYKRQILRASKEETLKRAVERSKLDRKTNIELVETMWEQFCNLGIYESNVIDTTTYSIQETVSAVQEKIASRAALLSWSVLLFCCILSSDRAKRESGT